MEQLFGVLVKLHVYLSQATYEIWNETSTTKTETSREDAPFVWAKHRQALRALISWKLFEVPIHLIQEYDKNNN